MLTIKDYSCIGEWVLIYNLGPINIGKSVTISHKAHLCAGTHDYKKRELPLLKKGIVLKDYSWVCTEAFIGPGCTVGEGSVVGARSVVIADVDDWKVFAGNPAKEINKRSLI